jgi:hypothetical protein
MQPITLLTSLASIRRPNTLLTMYPPQRLAALGDMEKDNRAEVEMEEGNKEAVEVVMMGVLAGMPAMEMGEDVEATITALDNG